MQKIELHIRPFLLFFIILVSNSIAQVTFTEVMYDPATTDNHDEFVEIYNLSDSLIDLTGWSFSDSTSQDLLIDAGRGMLLNPKNYAVILDGSYFANSTTYDNIIPDSVLIIKVDDNSIGSGLSNGAGKRLSLIDSKLTTVDQYKYVVGYPEGHSNEKIILTAGNAPSNWTQSLVLGGTPGMPNSVAPYEKDLGFDQTSLSWSPSVQLTTGQNVHFQIKIFNFGLVDFKGDFSLRLFIDSDQDSSFSASDKVIFDEVSSTEIAPDNYNTVETDYIFETGGYYNLQLELYNISEQNTLNNSVFSQLVVLDASAQLHINEIKFLAEENEPEWLELYNSGDHPVSLQGWAVTDGKDTTVIDNFAFIQPGQYKIVAADFGLDTLYNIEDSLILVQKHFPSLNNSEDEVFLLDPLGGWLEQLHYTTEWLDGEEWRNPSLERINIALNAQQAKNWGPSTAAENATPGEQNSIYAPVDVELKSKIKIEPNPFSPDGDGHDDNTIINIELPTNRAEIKIEIYDILGRKIRTIRDNSFSGYQAAVTWDGEDNNGRQVRMGIYIVYVQILNDREGFIKELKDTVVVAGKL